MGARPRGRRRGEIELQVAQLVEELWNQTDPVEGLGVYAVQAKRLAITLDNTGPDFLAVAAVNRELRELVKAMTVREAPSSGEPDSVAERLIEQLSTPLGDTPG